MSRNLAARIVISSALLIAGAAGGWIAHRKLAAAPAKDVEEHDQAHPAAAHVRVVTAIEQGSLPILATVVGVVEADPSALQTISGRAGGRVLETCVVKGQLVRAGETLLRFDRGPLEAALLLQRSSLAAAANQRTEFERVGMARVENELEAAQIRSASELALAKAQLERLAPLREEGLVAEKALADARSTLERAKLDHEIAARAALAWRERGGALQLATLQAAEAAAGAAAREAERSLDDAELKAPADGRVLSLTVRAGDRCEPLAPLGAVLVGDRRCVVFGTTPELAGSIPPKAQASWTEPGGVVRSGAVATVAARVGTDGLVDVVVAVDAGGVPALPGLLVRGEIQVGTTPVSTLVPLEALLRQGDEQYVTLKDARGLAHKSGIRVLALGRTQAAIEGELPGGARVVTSGGFNVPDGAALIEEAGAVEGKK